MAQTKWVAVIVVAVVAVAFVLFIATQQPAPDATDSQEVVQELPPEPVTVELRVHRGGYSPDRIEVPRGTPLTINIRTTDGLEHGFSLPVYDVSRFVTPGEVTTVEFTANAVGEWEFYSNIASNANAGNIRGVLVITE